MNVKECQVYLAIFKCFENKIMLIYANICKLGKSSHVCQTVVLACLVYTCIGMTGTCTICVPLRRGYTHTFEDFS